MFVNGVQAISSRLENLKLDYQRTMQPMSERPPVCPKTQLPHFQLTPSDAGQKKDGSPQATENPWLLKPQHEIPATPPPQTKQTGNFFQQRIG
ncbi:hypothetical protein RR48_11052 [Papilio machaon]|uniref:Uncharacterized protein n=1 Tax=Papilio machaon TaxID=76193 RepID=A0A194RQ31_PAPMA|nr:hypothetical protein RR48_11052 [Papilio machaon]